MQARHTRTAEVGIGTAPAPDSIVESSHDAIIGMTYSGVISSCNPAAARLFGYPALELIGQSAEVLVPPDRRPAENAVLQRILAGENVARYRTDRVCRDGSTITVSLTISPIADRTGAIVGAATISHVVSGPLHDPGGLDQADSTEGDSDRVRAAQAQHDRAALDAQAQEGQRLEVLAQLAGGVAHDFNNLLGVILNYAAFVGEELAAGADCNWEAARLDVGHIQRAAERATALTHQLQTFARSEVVQPRVLDLNQVVIEVQQFLNRTIGADVVLRTDLAPDLWPVLADAARMEQVLMNLAINARDAMSGGGTLSIDTANVIVDADFIAPGSPIRAGRHVRLRVGDTGTGMSADVLAQVFEPFFTTKPDGAGTGMGLSTVYGIIAQANAGIDIHSNPGIGTTFTIMMPVTDEAAVANVEPATHHRTPQGEMVLIVEDEQALREVTGRIFTRSGYAVIEASSGAEALTLAAGYPGEIHLLVTDVVMPNMLGKDVAEQIRAVKPEIQVLYMSGYARPVLASRRRIDPDMKLIEKPFTATSLIDRAALVLNGHFRGFHTVDTSRPDSPRAPGGTTSVRDPSRPQHNGEGEGGAPVWRILVVDDEPDLRFILSKILQRAGHDVVVAGDGEEALEAVRDSPPDLVVTDMMMPVMGGVELIRRLRADPSTADIPILAATSDTDLANGADAVLRKPYHRDQLLSAAATLLAQKADRR